MNTEKMKKWKEFLMENVNFAALRLMFGKQSASEIRASLEWEQKHR